MFNRNLLYLLTKKRNPDPENDPMERPITGEKNTPRPKTYHKTCNEAWKPGTNQCTTFCDFWSVLVFVPVHVF